MNIVAELAGADSLAAVVKCLNLYPKSKIYPTVVITPHESEENKDIVLKNYNLFIEDLKNKGYDIHPLIILDNNFELWEKLQNNSSFLSPCVACHLYCHLLRVNYAKTINGCILTGERKSHDGALKLNQNTITLDWFNTFFMNNNITFLKPLLDVSSTKKIDELLIDIPFDYKDKTNFIKCNYVKDKKWEQNLTHEELNSYLKNHLEPIAEEFFSHAL